MTQYKKHKIHIKYFLTLKLFFIGIYLSAQTYDYEWVVTNTLDPDPYDCADSLNITGFTGKNSLQWVYRKIAETETSTYHKISFNITGGSAPYTIDLQNDLPSMYNYTVDIDGNSQSANGYAGIEPKIIIDDAPKDYFASYKGEVKNISFFGSDIVVYPGTGSVLDSCVFNINSTSDDIYWYRLIFPYFNDSIVIQNCVFGTNRSGDATYESYDVGIHNWESYNSIYSKNIFKNPSYKAIYLQYGGNYDKSAPSINEITSTTISGTSEANDIIEIFSTTAPQNTNEYLTSITADASGNWIAEGLLIEEGDLFVATATDINNNTSELSDTLRFIPQEDSPSCNIETYDYIWTVTNTLDPDPTYCADSLEISSFSGVNSLRWVIAKINASAEGTTHKIEFNIDGTAPHTIEIKDHDGVADALKIYRTVTIDGATQPSNGYAGTEPYIHLKAQITNTNFNRGTPECIDLLEGSSCSIIKNITISHFLENGIWIEANNCTIENNVIHSIGVELYEAGAIYIASDFNTIKGNHLGTDRLLTLGLENIGAGIEIQGGSDNIIGGILEGEGNTSYSITSRDLPANIIVNGTDSWYPEQVTSPTLVPCERNLISGNILSNSPLDQNMPSPMGIKLYYSNNGKIRPDIIFVTDNTIIGTSEANDRVEIFKTNNIENTTEFIGRIDADALGNWTISDLIIYPGDLFIATATDVNNNTSELSDTLGYENACPWLELTQKYPIVIPTSPVIFSTPSYEDSSFTWHFDEIPDLEEGMEDYSIIIRCAPGKVGEQGTREPDWALGIENVYTYASLTAGQNYSEPMVDYVNPEFYKQTLYWQVGLIYQPEDDEGYQPIEWSTTGAFFVSAKDMIIPSKDHLLSTAHSNDINWVYSVSYLDDGNVSEGIVYLDGLGKTRQVQGKNYTDNVILTTETAYSEEGGGAVQSMIAPKEDSEFNYATNFFNVGSEDFSTEHFDRELRNQGETLATLIEPPQVDASSGSVGYYYSASNGAEPYVDDAGGYPYAYNVAYKSPLGRPLLTANGVGSTFKMTGGKETSHYYGKPEREELVRIFGKDYVDDTLDIYSISRSLVYDADGVGYLSYKDNEGKVIATALTACNTPSLQSLDEDGMDGYQIHINPLATEKMDKNTQQKKSVSKFDIPCGTRAVDLYYTLDLSSFTVEGYTCSECKYDVSITVTNNSTGEIILSKNKEVVPSDDVCVSGSETIEIIDTTMDLTGPNNFTVERTILPLTDKETGINVVEESSSNIEQEIEDNITTIKANFEEEYNQWKSYFVLRRNYTESNVPYFVPSMQCYDAYTLYGSGEACYRPGSFSGIAFSNPRGIAQDNYGNVYVADAGNHLIRKIQSIGQATNLAGMPCQTGALVDGTGEVARFNSPWDIVYSSAFETSGMLFVADKDNNALRQITLDGEVTTIASLAEGISSPEGLYADKEGNVYIACSGNNSIYKYSTLEVLSQVTIPVTLNHLCDVAINDSVIYVLDSGTSTVYKIYDGVATTIADNLDGLESPTSIGLDNFNHLFVSNTNDHTIARISLDESGYPIEFVSGTPNVSGDTDGINNNSEFNQPQGMFVDGFGDILLADGGNNKIKKLTRTICEDDEDPCLTSECGEEQWYIDEVNFATISGSEYIVDLDGYMDDDGTTVREKYEISSYSNPTVLSSGNAIYTYFDEAYYKQYSVDLDATNLEITVYNVTPAGTILTETQMPVLKDKEVIDVTDKGDYYLVKATIEKDCSLNCSLDDSEAGIDCDEHCEATREEYLIEMSIVFNEIKESNYKFVIDRLFIDREIPFYLLIDRFYPFNDDIYAFLPDERARELYLEYSNLKYSYVEFDTQQCKQLCNGEDVPPCDICNSNFMTCAYEKAEELINGANYLINKWTANLDAGGGFPFTADSLIYLDDEGNERYNLNIQEELGDKLFQYIYQSILTSDAVVTDIESWEPSGGSCPNCTPSESTQASGCSKKPEYDVTQVPSVLIPLFNEMMLDCDTQYMECFELNDPVSYDTYVCEENINNCVESVGTADMYETQEEYDELIANCQLICDGYPADHAQRVTLVRETTDRLYPGMENAGKRDTITTDILTAYADSSMQKLQNYLFNYEAVQSCLNDCNTDFEYAFHQYMNNYTTVRKDAVVEEYINQCYGTINESFDISYSQNFYHYTLYKYDYANNLVATVPPDGIDYIDVDDPSDADRTPQHRMQSNYTSNSLYTLSYESPDEGKTEYIYDKAGRIRFSQDAVQREQTGSFSYTKYNAETGRITEVGEYYNGTADFNADAQTQADNLSWPSSSYNQFQTYYEYDDTLLSLDGYKQEHMKGRLSKMRNSSGATYFSYDAHGRVTFVAQEVFMGAEDTAFFTVDYVYSPVTSRVEQIIYQKDVPEESFYHRYLYDADSRLGEVQVSRDGEQWMEAANYAYYTHGPLKAKILGDSIQKVDYVYNINGWLKAINNPIPGADLVVDDSEFGEDVFAEAINYFSGDYTRTGVGLSPNDALTATPGSGSTLATNAPDLFSGNISSTITNTAFRNTAMSSTPDILAQGYTYDCLNRLVETYAETATHENFTGLTGSADNQYKVTIGYDANGNIENLSRLRENGLGLDDLTYHYATQDIGGVPKKANNRLLHVNDAVTSSDFTDIKDMGVFNQADENSWNYAYDAKGRIIKNLHDSIASIEWTPYDKVKRIVPLSGYGKETIEFTYNAMQQRLSKKVIKDDGDYDQTFYAYDASGVLMSTYTLSHTPTTQELLLNEHMMYGSSRLGTYATNEFINDTLPTEMNLPANQRFELTDHLGTVRAVVTGEKTNGEANILALTDYYPFGMDMPGRIFTGENYRFGYQGSERDRELMGGNAYTTYFRQLDPRLGRWMSPDPMRFAAQTPYASMDNNPVWFVDPFGAEGDPPKKDYDPAKDPGYVGDENTAYVYANKPESTMNPMDIGTNANDFKIYGLLHSIAQKINDFESNLNGEAEQAWGKSWYSKGNGEGSTATKTKIGFDPETLEDVDEILEMLDLMMKQFSDIPGKQLTGPREVLDDMRKDAKTIRDLVRKGKVDYETAKLTFTKVKDVSDAITERKNAIAERDARDRTVVNIKNSEQIIDQVTKTIGNDLPSIDLDTLGVNGQWYDKQGQFEDDIIDIFVGSDTLRFKLKK